MRSVVSMSFVAAALASATSVFAVTNPFTETFSSSAANWATASTGPGSAPLTYNVSGGPDGSGYGSGTFGFAANGLGDTPILFRAQNTFGSSSGNLAGNWLTSGVTSFSFSVRDNVPGNVTFFARFVANGAFTGVVYQVPAAIPANTWTTFTIPINSGTSFIYEGSPALFNSTFSNVNAIQIGVISDASIAGQAGPFTFDIDNVSIVPAPAAGSALLGAAGLFTARRRRR